MTDPIMDAGAWRREALGLRERVRELEADAERWRRHADALEVDRLIRQRDSAERRAATHRAELADLRAEREALYAVVRAARAALTSPNILVGPTLLPLSAALDALPCWCGKPDGHASGCPGG